MTTKQTIEYVDAIPGMGKTRWSLKQAKKIATNKRSILLYVAPTTKLLFQSSDELEIEYKVPLSQIHRQYSMEEGNTNQSITRDLTHLFESTNTGDIEGKRNRENRLLLGDIVFVTHPTFTQMDFSKYPNLLANAIVIFDEARKVARSDQVAVLRNPRERQLLEDLLRRHCKPTEHTDYPRFKPNLKTFRKELSSIIESVDGKRKFHDLDLKLSYVRNPKVDVFLYFSKDKKSVTLFEVILPTRIFDGFKRVVLLAAHFKDSQMHHILAVNPNVELVDITDKVFGSPSHQKRLKILLNRYKYVTIAPITKSNNLLSKYQINSQCLIDVDKYNMLDTKIEKVSDIPKILRGVRARTIKQSNLSTLITNLKPIIEVDPMRYYLKTSYSIIQDWRQNMKTQEGVLVDISTRLLSVNKDQTSKAERFSIKIDEDGEGRTYRSNPFKILPFTSNGLNNWWNDNVLVFLAAVNPEPRLIEFFEQYIPEYKFENDYVADVCIQSLGRLSVRNSKAKTPVLLVVTDNKVAQLLKDKTYGRGVIDHQYSGPYLPLSQKLVSSNRLESLHSLSDEERDRMKNNLKVSIFRLRKSLKEETDKVEIKKLKVKLSELLEIRTLLNVEGKPNE